MTSNSASLESAQASTARRVEVGSLLLDTRNPRLASGFPVTSQGDLLRVLWEELAVDEVAWSIAHNGYYEQEPLLVIREGAADKDPSHQRFIVLEGNRRLAAVLLLRDVDLRQKIRATDLPRISAKRNAELGTLPVVVYPDRESLWTYLGFRHINGAKPWDAFSKASYIAEVHERYGVALDSIADSIGDRHSLVKRQYRGLKVLEQAQSKVGFDIEDRVANKFHFSHLYTALEQAEFQNFLSISSDGSLKSDPVPRSKLENLKELMVWLFGRKSTDQPAAVRTQNPDLNRLRRVIGNRQSLAALRSGYGLDRAYEISVGDPRRFQESLAVVKQELQQAMATVVTGYKGDDDLDRLVDEIGKLVASLRTQMESQKATPAAQR